MLDDLKYIHGRDKSDALGVAEKQWQQLLETMEIKPALKSKHVYNVVFAGMGGSALSPLFARAWPVLNEPMEIVRGYSIPEYVDGDTLFIASSYSGNTEETLSALKQAEDKRAQIVVITNGGKLAETDHPTVLLPKVIQPRMAAFASYKALLTVLDAVGVSEDSVQELEKAAEFIKQSVNEWRPDRPTKGNQAKQIALEIIGTSPVIYGGPVLFPAAYKWKININENAKNIAWCNQLPEFNHNEFMGWTSHPVDKPYGLIDLRTDLDHPQIQKRFDISSKLLSGKRPHPITVNAKGKTRLEQLLWTVCLGDFVSIYMAILNNVDPTPVALIKKLKKELV